MDGILFQLDCPAPQQLWPAYAGPGPGYPVVGYFKHGDLVWARYCADGWLELPRRQGFLKTQDPERAHFLKAQHNRYRDLLEEDRQEEEGIDSSVFGWHAVLVADGLHMVPLSQLQSRHLACCDACGENLHDCDGGHALALGCGHAFHPHCIAHWPSPSICSACHHKCTPPSTTLLAIAAPIPPPATTLHFSALPPATHFRLALLLLALASLALLRANHALLAVTLLPLRRLLTSLLLSAIHALAALPGHALRSPLHAWHLLCWLLSTALWLPGALLRGTYHTPAAAFRTLSSLPSLVGALFHRLSTLALPLYHLLLHHLPNLITRLPVAVSSFWAGYWRWLPASLHRQLAWLRIPLGRLWARLVPLGAEVVVAEARALLAAAVEMPATVWAVESAAQLRAVAGAEWWVERRPEVAMVVVWCQEGVAGWGPGSTAACGVALLAVVGLCVAGRKVRI